MNKINERNRSKKLRRKIIVNFNEGDLWVTLTYAKGKRPADEKEAKKEINKFMRKLRYRFQKMKQAFKWILSTEYMASAIHHHLIVNNPEGMNVMKLINESWTRGHPSFKALYEDGNYAALADYVVKEAKGRVKKTAYTCSRNLQEPKVTRTVVSANSWLKEPKAQKGYVVDKTSICMGISDITGYPYQYYSMYRIDKDRGKGDT